MKVVSPFLFQAAFDSCVLPAGIENCQLFGLAPVGCRRFIISRETSSASESHCARAVSFLRPCRGSRPPAFKQTTFLWRGDFPQLPRERLPSAALLLLAEGQRFNQLISLAPPSAIGRRTLHWDGRLHFQIRPSFCPVWTNASTANLMSSWLWTADGMSLMRAFPCGTVG